MSNNTKWIDKIIDKNQIAVHRYVSANLALFGMENFTTKMCQIIIWFISWNKYKIHSI